jgi:hypothetical protein
MFSGYGQSQGQTERILSELEKYMEERHQRDRAFDAIERWDEADVYRLVSAFLGEFRCIGSHLLPNLRLTIFFVRGEISDGTCFE